MQAAGAGVRYSRSIVDGLQSTTRVLASRIRGRERLEACGAIPRAAILRGAAVIALLALPGCSRSTAALAPEVETRLTTEGVVRRADDALFRYTEGGGRRGGMWDEGRASIVVTRRTVYLHQDRRVMLDLTSTNAADYSVRRDHDRVAIHTGGGRSSRTWSFRPPQDPEGWARDLRAVLRSGQ